MRVSRLVRRATEANPLPPGTAAVGVGLLITGLTSYAFLVLTGRTLGPSRYAPLSALWALVFLAGPGFFLPLEQEVGRLIASRRVEGLGGGAIIRRAALVGSALAAALLCVSFAAISPLRRTLFDGQTLLFLGFVLALVGYAISHLTRGTLSGSGRFRNYSVAIAGDSTLRLIGAVVLIGAGVKSAGPYGLVLGATPAAAAAMAMWRQTDLLDPGPEAPLGELSRALGWLLAGSALGQLLANASVLAVKVLATRAQHARAGQFLAGLIVARVPLFLFGAVQAALLPSLASLAGAGRHGEFRLGLRRLLVVVAAIGAVATLGAIAIGPGVVRVLFGASFRLGRADLGYLAAGSGAFMITLAVSQAIIALGLHARAAVGWIVGNVVFVVVTAVTSGLLLRVELGFLAGSTAAAVVSGLLLLSSLPATAGERELDGGPLRLDQLGLEP